ncbi:metallophosphoesterase family protein [Halobacillus sp. BBL2006]|uniref:metallophosphoesterase family protein n=1 Tax=Halobacillus sp. BBL2006 TaxID=1543706 RepID=UPI00054202B4|nr:metallophosphoesterase family protein [Halobacillus sp. BBL2006]KHE67436.1 phosphodiesterase [Halobacillus sp. BBL2006]
MKVVIVSDTHIAKKEAELPVRLMEELPSAELIIHAGDWNIPEVYDQLESFAPVHGVYGNVDGIEIQELVPDKQIIDVKGFKIGIVHGHGEKKTTEKRVVEAFAEDNADIIVFGHSHIPLLRYFKKQLLFNPGSPTAKRKLPYYSFGIMTFNEETFEAKHIFY